MEKSTDSNKCKKVKGNKIVIRIHMEKTLKI